MKNTADIDTGFAAALAGLGRLDGSARVGALDEKNAQKLAWQEFGTSRGIPPRPTLTTTTDALTPAMDRMIKREVSAVLDGKGRGVTGQEILADVGRALAEEVRQSIDGNTPPPLADSTIAARRARGNPSTRTLVDTGEMMRSIKVETSDDPKTWRDGD